MDAKKKRPRGPEVGLGQAKRLCQLDGRKRLEFIAEEKLFGGRGERAPALIEDICCEKIRGCSYRRGNTALPHRTMPHRTMPRRTIT